MIPSSTRRAAEHRAVSAACGSSGTAIRLTTPPQSGRTRRSARGESRDTRVAPCPSFWGSLTSRRSDPSVRRSGEGTALRWDEDATGDGGQPDPGRRVSWQAPRELRGPRIPQDPRSVRPAQHPVDRAPRPVVPEQDPRRATPNPRPAGTASTGQLPVARTRENVAGPTGTARIPVQRQAPQPVRPRRDPRVRQPEGPRHGGQPPVRSRLRTPPPAPPQTRPFSQLQPTAPVRPFSQLAPVAIPLPPTPIDFAPIPAPARPRRHPVRGFLAALAVLALGVLWGLPAFASEALDAPPVDGIQLDGDVQQLSVGQVQGAATADSISGSLPVDAAPSWIKPVNGHLGDPFGPRPEQPVPGVSLFHRGQDIVAPCGTPIHAAASGTVTTATWWGTYGNWILVDNGGGVATGYAHASEILVSVGQHVTVGQVIGLVGETGAATGCHLHLEVHLNGVAVNPVPFFAAKGISLG